MKMLTCVIPLNLQLCKLRRIRETDWDMEDVLPVSFAPLMNCKENMKAPPRFIEIRKFISWLIDLVKYKIWN